MLMTAAASCGLTEILKSELEGIARLAVASGGFYEIYNPETQKPDGGWQTGCQWDSVYDQTWSATGFIRGIVYGLFGINLTEEGIEFRPCLPKNFKNVKLQGICFRNIELDISLFGCGSNVVSMMINNEIASTISFSKPGRYCVEIWLNE